MILSDYRSIEFTSLRRFFFCLLHSFGKIKNTYDFSLLLDATITIHSQMVVLDNSFMNH